MVRYFYLTRREAERTYLHRVDIPVPPNGFGNTLNQMAEWCHQRFTEWEDHGIALEQRDARGTKIDAVRFYFMEEIAAQQFRERWGPA